MSDNDDHPSLESADPRRARPFSRALLATVGVLFAVFVWFAGRLLLLIFAGVLLGILLRTAAQFVSRYTRLSTGTSLAIVLVLVVGAAVAAGALFAPRLAEQAQQLSERVPEAFSKLVDRLRGTPWGDWVLEQVSGGAPGQQKGEVVQRAADAASRVLDALVAIVVVLFVGGYLASDPQPYVRGFLRLVPLGRRRRIGEVLFAAGYQLRWWLVGQLASMLIVGLMMGIGLTIIGIPLAFALGVLAGLLEFIPTIGPPIAVIPALLLALVDDPQKAVYVLILYAIVQTVESYLLTPLVQQRVVHLSPVVTISAQVFFAWIAGPLGLLVAVPIVAVAQIAVQMLYVEDFLGDPMPVGAEEEARRELDEADIFNEQGAAP